MKNLRSYIPCMTFTLVSLVFPMAVRADNPHVCMALTPDATGGPAVTLNVFASNVPGSVSTVFGLNGTGLSTQASANPPVQLSYILTGTGIVTSKGAIEASLAGTALDSTCNCLRESTFHVVIDGQNNSYTQIIRTVGGQPDAVMLTGSAAFASTCDKGK